MVHVDADVDELIRRLALPYADDAYLGGDRGHMAARVHEGWLYLSWYDSEFAGAPEGDPESPETHGTTEAHYYPGSGVSLELGARALRQWLATDTRPDLLTWVDRDVLYEQQFGQPSQLTPHRLGHEFQRHPYR